VSKKDLDDAIGVEESNQAAVGVAKTAVDKAHLGLDFTELISSGSDIAELAKAQN
jgi:hypothetical protein